MCYQEGQGLREKTAILKRPTIKLGPDSMTFPVNMKTDDYLEFWGIGPARLFDRNEKLLNTIIPQGKPLNIPYGKMEIELSAELLAPVKWTTITLGKPSNHQE